MDNGNNEIKFVEEKARELVYYLLTNDTNIFKKLIPEIKAMDSNSFKNLFNGTPFKSENNKDGYDYQVQNKKSFERLLDKFDNFNVILEAWYLDQKYYEYLKKLWRNYISIESLRNKSDNEFEFEKFLENYDIDYKKWPQNIKNDFKIQINNTKKTEIWEDKKKNEYKNEASELKNLMKKLQKFKNLIEDEPEMEIYKENTDKLIDKLKTFLDDLFEKIKKFFSNKKIKKILEYLSYLSSGSIIIPSSNNINLFSPEESNNINNNFNYDEYYPDIENENDYKDGGFSKETIKEFFENNFVVFLYTAVSFLNLGWSVYQYIQASKELKKIKNDIKGYKKELKKINENFNEHKEKLGILPDDFKESIKLIKEIFTLISQDYQQLDNLIKKIEESIEISNQYKNESTMGLIGSGLLSIFGIVGGIFARNGKSILYGFSAFSNIISAFSHGSTLIESSKLIKELRKVVNNALEQKNKIIEELDKLLNLLKSLESNYPKYK